MLYLFSPFRIYFTRDLKKAAHQYFTSNLIWLQRCCKAGLAKLIGKMTR